MMNRRRRTSSSMTSSAEENSQTRRLVHTNEMRRSGRPRSGPTNYYANCYANLDSDDALEPSTYKPINSTRSSQQRSIDLTTDCIAQPSNNIPAKNHDRCSIIHASPMAQIRKFPFRTEYTEEMTHLPYSPERNPSDYTRKIGIQRLQTDVTLHVDFNQHEMTALLEILSFYGLRRLSQPDMALADQVIQTLSLQTMPTKTSKKISRVRRLSRLLLDEGVSDSSAWLVGILKSTPGGKKLRKARELTTKILGLNLSAKDGLDIHRLSDCLQHAQALIRRSSADIDSFITDAIKGHIPTVPYVVRASRPPNCQSSSWIADSARISRKHLQRELGGYMHRDLRSRTATNFKLAKTWKGASDDVNVLAWSPDGTRFAAGATAHCDEHNMEYNRGNNLVLGNLVTDILEELPDHYIARPSGRAALSRTVNDPRLFMSVTSMEWHHDALFTASYDKTVKVWKFPNNKPKCCKTLPHDSQVHVMARSNFDCNMLATGASSIRLWNIEEAENYLLDFPKQRSKKELVPTSVAWGTTSSTRNILLAGMSEKDDMSKEDRSIPKNGLLAMWKISEASWETEHLSPNSQNIFDIKWHPTLPLFATASSAPNGAQLSFKDTKSVVRLYQPQASKRSTIEFECPALDINEVTICPTNSNYVTASCTDGVTYVWDSRNSDHILHRLPHGAPLEQIDETLSREEADVGVRMALWGQGIDEFYTGASDGVLKYWDISRSPEDVLVKDVVCFQGGIMCGALSGDRSNLLVGDATGGIYLLSPSLFTDCENPHFDFQRADVPASDSKPDLETAVDVGREHLSSGRLRRHPLYGVGQGPCYDGPFAAWARPKFTAQEKLATTRLTPYWQMRQLYGIPVEHRRGLDDQARKDIRGSIQLAHIRNQRPNENKRRRTSPEQPHGSVLGRSHTIIDLCSDEEDDQMTSQCKRQALNPRRYGSVVASSDLEVIDLTGDTDEEDSALTSPRLNTCIPSPLEEPSQIHFAGFDALLENLEEDFWWPGSGEVDANIQEADV
ncbi:hypothetical protein FE257_004310 [Aspergillus nanangensis]|uniref:WD repeat protein n=1 Tax=Aspergillus nanangensis TaxID=2582783 RepID=A0AAD4CB36_ASPNN|nr:hypothetical protein FE257_004310 [Aspergillus nanangensis]